MPPTCLILALLPPPLLPAPLPHPPHEKPLRGIQSPKSASRAPRASRICLRHRKCTKRRQSKNGCVLKLPANNFSCILLHTVYEYSTCTLYSDNSCRGWRGYRGVLKISTQPHCLCKDSETKPIHKCLPIPIDQERRWAFKGEHNCRRILLGSSLTCLLCDIFSLVYILCKYLNRPDHNSSPS